MTRASLDRRPDAVAAMFDSTADRYDLMNDVLSMGQDRLWRTIVARAVDAKAGERVLDLAAGTGTSTAAFARAGAQCVACDFSTGMLEVGVRRRGQSAGGVTFVGGDAMRLPFADDSFDAVTISFGIRNVVDPDACMRELRRVAKPGGRMVICEFSHIPVRPVDRAFTQYLVHVMPRIAGLLSSNPESYGYLSESIQTWPDQRAMAARIQRAGWTRVAWRNLSFGIAAVHRAWKPDEDAEKAA
ncbi:MAG TPA: demethylmenaquinone methyltransferase [Streptosporangiaceae bacterium]|jgi:demethylmenaquinone methyltransferase/2-methoxy-6-polyprenyl-1,4-benzoquinol methylase